LARRPAPRLPPDRRARIRTALDALLEESAFEYRLTRDPLSFPRRYEAEDDVEVAAFIAACLAFGRVASFLPVIDALLGSSEDYGGPANWARGLQIEHAETALSLQYRWVRGRHLVLLVATLGSALREHGRLGALFEAHVDSGASDIGSVLEGGLSELHRLAKHESERLNLPPETHRERGFVSLLSRPSGGSACKRMCMLLRWMSRLPSEGAAGVDLGLWAIPPSSLVIPLDTHVLHLSRLIGLTNRTDGTWRTALEITQSLRRLYPEDPVRYDFALAHLGISGACKRRYIGEICQTCTLLPVCRHGVRHRSR
jgi:uncharacterized protein (TIGR02757 family)